MHTQQRKQPLPSHPRTTKSSHAHAMIPVILISLLTLALLLELSGCSNLSNLDSLEPESAACPELEGLIACGRCTLDPALTDNPHAGQCSYCIQGTTCASDPCEDVKCPPSKENKAAFDMLVMKLMGKNAGTVQTISAKGIPSAGAKPDVSLEADSDAPALFALRPAAVDLQYDVYLQSGTIPPGMILDPTGLLRGRPIGSGATDFTVCSEYPDERPQSCVSASFTVNGRILDPEEGCCMPACLITKETGCPQSSGLTFNAGKSCDALPQCRIGCCTMACVMDRKQKCEDAGLPFYDQDCDKLPQCEIGCCMPICKAMGRERCEMAGLTFSAGDCAALPDCKMGCCTPRCTMMAKSACEFIGVDNVKRGTFHTESCDDLEICSEPSGLPPELPPESPPEILPEQPSRWPGFGLWKGTFQSHTVFHGLGTCVTDTTAPITLCLKADPADKAKVSGVISFYNGFDDKVTTPDNAFCPPTIHCPDPTFDKCSQMAGHIGAGTTFILDSLIIDGAAYTYNPLQPYEKVQASVLIVADTMNAFFTDTGYSGTTTYSTTIGNFSATKASDTCS